MLRLQNTYTGYPFHGFRPLCLPHEALIIYPSADSIVILNAHSLLLVCVLAFWEAYPRQLHTRDNITCIAADHRMKLIVAAMNTRIAVWSLSEVERDVWRLHSTLTLPDGHPITKLDCKAGLLAVGSMDSLSVFTLILENDLPTWSLKWMAPTFSPFLLSFAPSLMYIATTTASDNVVRLYSTTSGRLTQTIPHLRPVINLAWRQSEASSRDELILYTITSDSVLRIFLPVIDSPEYLQLHASLDFFSSTPLSISSTQPFTTKIFWLERDVVLHAIKNTLSDSSDECDGRRRRLHEIHNEGLDLFLRVFDDGSLVITAVANLDRRPPTLLRQFTLLHLSSSSFRHPPDCLFAVPGADPLSVTLITSAPFAAYSLNPLIFFDAQTDGLQILSNTVEPVEREEAKIVRFIRTPEGTGLGVLRSDGSGEAWHLHRRKSRLVCSHRWSKADFVVPLDGGRTLATYSKNDNCLTLYLTPPKSVRLPLLESLFTMPSSTGQEQIFGITSDFTTIIQLTFSLNQELGIVQQSSLPLDSPPKFILPVDPMAWGSNRVWKEHDVLLSVSDNGKLAFWVPEATSHLTWRCTGTVRTGRTGIKKARCSSAKKTALVVHSPEGDELSIWDSTESEFASGLEYLAIYSSEPILDLDWTSTPDMQSILAVGFAHRVELLCEQRMTYFDDTPGWNLLWTVDISSLTPYPISDSIWLANGSLLVAAGNNMFLYGDGEPPQPMNIDQRTAPSLFEYVAGSNGPLQDYHPQMLLQCLLWDKVELVKEVIVNLARYTEQPVALSLEDFWITLPVDRYFRRDINKNEHVLTKPRYSLLFNGPATATDESGEEVFSRARITHLVEALEKLRVASLTPNEQAHLLVIIQATLEIDEQRRSLDSNGLRFLISMRSFYIFNSRASPSVKAPSIKSDDKAMARRERLRYRDMIWAFHSESQDLLLTRSLVACNEKMNWADARALGIPIWLTSTETLKSQLEVIARNEYMSGENRDPTACSIFYFALGKVKLVHGLWRQSVWHKEQALMLKFLSNDFTEPRWRTAALKNAYALLSKRRFEYAAAFFLLGGSLKDAVSVCIKQLGDFQLAIALARVIEGNTEGPILQGILIDTVLPTAFQLGNRWLGSWAFWLLHRRDLAVRILLTPLQDVAHAFNVRVTEIGEPHYDDPSLALLFSQLRSKTLQAAKGTSEISGRSEFSFVLQISRVFCRMGCHALALDLVRSWSFDRTSTIRQDRQSPMVGLPSSFSQSRHSSIFSLNHSMRRRSSILIDMDIPSPSQSGNVTPEKILSEKNHRMQMIGEEDKKVETDLLARKVGLGKLMQTAKQDVQVPEFDMGAFF